MPPLAKRPPKKGSKADLASKEAKSVFNAEKKAGGGGAGEGEDGDDGEESTATGGGSSGMHKIEDEGDGGRVATGQLISEVSWVNPHRLHITQINSVHLTNFTFRLTHSLTHSRTHY